jgi:hypothetical protein
MITIEQTLQTVATSGRTHANPKVRVLNNPSVFAYGKWVRQGDVMIQRLELEHGIEDIKTGAATLKTDNRQVAPGDTKGSRHVVRENSAAVYMLKGADALTGPMIMAVDGFYLEHPTHADMDIRLPGCYRVTFPRDLTGEAKEEARRRAD